MKKSISCAIFISDVGFGHMVRQRQIIFELKKKIRNIDITIFHQKNLNVIRKTFNKRVNYINNFNNIKLNKTSKGFLDKKKAIHDLKKWPKKTEVFLNRNEKKLKKFDFFISDLVPEISYYAKKINKPCFSICHYTWDWFFNRLVNHKKVVAINLMKKYTKMSTKIYFPPLTNHEILKDYKNKKEVSFITNKLKLKKNNLQKKFKILIMNNGTETLTHLINNIIIMLSKMKHYKFFISTGKLSLEKRRQINKIKNIFLIDSSLKQMYSFINKVDLVLARGGYNTISECLILKKPSILSYENKNPEIFENLKIMREKKYSGTMNYKDWSYKNFRKKLENFLKKDFFQTKKILSRKKFKNNGAKEIVNDIKKELKKFYDKNYC
ncbi:hypothetical protein N9L17_03865 [Candidatus Pelagibacter bacterium]|jgi:uncharacterized protein (TIGR00661 family)|nr:hypothetical protein [Candidatus Pelagibacter bacterium]